MALNLLKTKEAFIHPQLTYNFRIYGIPGLEGSLNIKSASIPGVTYNPIPVQFSGRKVNFNGNVPTYANWDITIQEDVTYTARNALEAWLSLQGDAQTSVGLLTPIIQKSVYAHLLEPGTSRIVAVYQLINAFPISLSPVTLDQATPETVMNYTAGFVYDYWIRQAISDSYLGMSKLVQSALGI